MFVGHRDIEQLARRIEELQRKRGADLLPADRLTLDRHLPGSRGSQVLPEPKALRAMPPEGITRQNWQCWLAWVSNCESAVRSSSNPHNPRRVMHDLRRGRITPATLPFLAGRGRR